MRVGVNIPLALYHESPPESLTLTKYIFLTNRISPATPMDLRRETAARVAPRQSFVNQIRVVRHRRQRMIGAARA